MPIDKNNKIIFIHIPKCGGTSIAKSLKIYDKWDKENLDILYGFTKKDKIVLQSLCLEFYDKFINENEIKKCKIFTVVRNPYDRILSDFCWGNRGFQNIYDYIVHIKNTLENTSKYDLMKLDLKYFPNHFLPQYEYINSEKYKIDIIIRFENLNEEFSQYFPNKRLPHLNKTKHTDFITYFKDKPECIKLINEIYDEDFKKFNYIKL